MAQEAPKPEGKGRPTPKRKDQEAALRRPLVLDRKQDAARRRAEGRVRYQREMEAMANGDERHMPANHAGAPRRFARDYIDSRTTVAEFLLPLSLVALFAMMFLVKYPQIISIASLALFLTILAATIESAILLRRLRKAAVAKFGEERLPRLYRLYGLTRLLQVRRLRMPKPQVKRGQFPS